MGALQPGGMKNTIMPLVNGVLPTVKVRSSVLPELDTSTWPGLTEAVPSPAAGVRVGDGV